MTAQVLPELTSALLSPQNAFVAVAFTAGQIVQMVGMVVLGCVIAYLIHAWKKQQSEIRHLEKERSEIDAEEHRMFDFLHGLGEALYEDRNARKMHELIVEGVANVVVADGCTLYLLDRQGKALVPTYQTPNCPGLIPIPEEVSSKSSPNAMSSHLQLTSLPVKGESIVAHCLAEQKSERIADVAAHEHFGKGDAAEKTSVMIAPLSYGSKRLGIIATANTKSGAFSSHDFDVFKSVAEQSAFALGNALIHQEALEKRKIEDELKAASEIQKVLLPSRSPELEDYAIAGMNLPAKVVSGDYYDYVKVDHNHYGVAIADVSGKGIPASLVMASCRSVLRSSARGNHSPSGALKKVNRMIFPDIREDMFISMAYCILNRNTDEIVLARAGHDAPLLYRSEDGSVEKLKPPGLAVGIDKGPVFDRVTQNMTISMRKGDCLLLYTDGVNEAVDESGLDEFGTDRLIEEFKNSAPGGAENVLSTLENALEAFVGSHPRSDDITLIAIEKR